MVNSFELNLLLQIWPRQSQLLSKIYRNWLANIFTIQFLTKPYSSPEIFKNFILNILPINRSNIFPIWQINLNYAIYYTYDQGSVNYFELFIEKSLLKGSQSISYEPETRPEISKSIILNILPIYR